MGDFKDEFEDELEDEFEIENLGLLREIYEAGLQELESRNDDDYEVDKVQMAKLVYAYRFFSDLAKRDHGHVDPFDVTPKMEHSGITAYFTVFYVYGDELKEFTKILDWASGFSLDTTLDGEVCISFNIPNVFKLKQQP